jgi:hypothetical protein
MATDERPGSQASDSRGRIGFRVRMAVTGHRRIDDRDEVAKAVLDAFGQIQQMLPPTKATPVAFTVVSSLAEGADRLVAREAFGALADQGVELEAALPMPASEYLSDFPSEESRAEFEQLMSLAAEHRQLTDLDPHQGVERDTAYERAGRYVVDRSDVLIALWDGKPARGKGGTAEIVAYAQQHDVPVLRVTTNDSGPPALTDAPTALGSEALDSLGSLDDYNATAIPDDQFERQRKREDERLGKILDGSPILDQYRLIAAWALPFLVRADMLALRYQRRYNRVGRTIHFLAALAVTAVAGQLVWARENPNWLLIEVGLMLLLVAILSFGRRGRFHERWVSYRSLAEAFRSSIFIALSGARHPGDTPSDAAQSELSQSWFQRAFSEAWADSPALSVDEDDAPELTRFIETGWVDDQIAYYKHAADKAAKLRVRYTRTISALASATVVVALLHIFKVGHETWVQQALEFVAIVLPAFGAAVAGLREQGHYRLHEERSRRAAGRLETLKAGIPRRTGLRGVQSLAAETQTLLLDENSDWSGVTEFQDLELVV